jgi:hypothetical protein
VDGRANAALVKFLARILGVKAGDLAIATGLAGRSKTVKIDGLGREAAEGRLLADLAPAEAPAGGGPLEAGPEACGRRRRGR